MSDGKWVKLPKGAQVTMSRGEYEATQGVSLRDKAIIAGVIFGVVWVYGALDNDDRTPDKPLPQTSVSAPAKAGE
jgi:hypothetical protein